MIETTGEFKKAIKTLVKGAIKSKLFGGEAGDYKFVIGVCDYDKVEKVGTVSVGIVADCNISMCILESVSTRVYNKVNEEFFAPIAAQFEKLKNVNSITFTFEK